MSRIEPIVTRAELEALSDKHLTVRRWLRGKKESAPDTWYSYSRYMVLFNRSTGKNPDQFLEWAKTVDGVEVDDLIAKVAEGIVSPASRFNFKVDMRSFLHTNGFNNLPKANLSYTLKTWHRGYKREEIRAMLGFLDNTIHKLYVYLALESGLRAKTALALKYGHIKEDFEAGVVPCAIRLGPEFYGKKKSAGFTFLGEQSVALIRECVKNGWIKTEPDSLLLDRAYTSIFNVLARAREKAGIDRKIQPNHGLRKYFEDALDKAAIDGNVKAMIEGHFDDTRSKHYTGREWDDLRASYKKAYPLINVDSVSPEIEQKIGSWELERAEMKQEISELRKLVQQMLENKKQ